jgi:hypothetical protein
MATSVTNPIIPHPNGSSPPHHGNFNPRMNNYAAAPQVYQIPQAPPMSKKVTYHLMIKNLPANVQDEYIFSEIKNTCNIKSFKVPRKPNGETKGKCFLELWTNEPKEITAAKKKLRTV